MAIELNYIEKDIEDILEQHCEKMLGIEFESRQYSTPVGIVDIIATHPEEHYCVKYVVEIKRGKLDASAYAQVLRYTAYLNSEESDDGQIIYLPLLIGESLASELSALCDYFDPEDHVNIGSFGRVMYRCFDFDPLRGVSFNYHSNAQKEYETSLMRKNCHIGNMQERLDDLEMRMQDMRAMDALTSPNSLKLAVNQ